MHAARSSISPLCAGGAAARLALSALLLLAAAGGVAAAEAAFLRAVNLNGPALTIDGHQWDGGDAAGVTTAGNAFENQAVPLKPATDVARARMIRSSRWGAKVEVTIGGLAAGPLQVFLYVWEDNHSERFDLLVDGTVVQAGFDSGAAGAWKRLGPWPAQGTGGTVTVSARGPEHGAANLSGIEVWSAGTLPAPAPAAFSDAPTSDQVAFFENRIRPLLAEHCYECHAAGAKRIKGGLVLDSRAGVRKGGDTGAVIAPGDPEASMLIQAVRHLDEDSAMPPKAKLAPALIADLETWVRMGAPDPRGDDTLAAVQKKSAIDWSKGREWWAFRPLALAPPPAVRAEDWPSDDIDRFILARLDQAGLTPAPDAEPRVLIRRATYDLTGLPPTVEEVDAFLADRRPQAFATVVDRLLASERYGERWGRHWLDVVRYADTAGDNSDFPIPQMRRYRDWVIDAFNRDLPYDQFVREQLAGDLIAGDGPERAGRIIATGYLANARRFGSRVEDYPWHLTIEDTIGNLGRTFLGLSLSCARCHDHKFDPISTQDYYALYGIFSSTRYPWPGIELEQRQRDLVPLVPAGQTAQALAAIAAQGTEQKRLDEAVKELKEQQKKAAEDGKKAFDERIASAEKAAAAHKAAPLPFAQAYAVSDDARHEDAQVQFKGDPAKPGERVRRHFLTVFGGAELPAGDQGSGRRALAEWILAADNPLTPRVMANRLWLSHFGRGLVPTPNDFGKQGRAVSHPELLDHLANRLRSGGWSLKAMQRAIMLSHTYRQSSLRSPAALDKDPGNELLAAFPRLRLDAESLRDTLLAQGGSLDLSPAGDHPFPPASEWRFTQHNPFKAVYEHHRRSVYLMTQRIQRHPFLAVFDGADPSTSTPERLASTTPLQALFLLNDPLVHEQARLLAGHLVSAAASDEARIVLGWRQLFCRPPRADELQAATAFLAATRTRLRAAVTPDDRLEPEAWSGLVRVWFRLNEFVYLD